MERVVQANDSFADISDGNRKDEAFFHCGYNRRLFIRHRFST